MHRHTTRRSFPPYHQANHQGVPWRIVFVWVVVVNLFVVAPHAASSVLNAAEVAAAIDKDSAAADTPDERIEIEFFEQKIRPVLAEHCYRCHATDAKKVRGGLLLDSRDAIRQGGESGSGVVPGNPAESLVLSALRHESFEMPPDGRLPDSVIADFERWIERGAADPRDVDPATGRDGRMATIDMTHARNFWSFQPVAPPALPEVKNVAWPESMIDRFVLSRLEAEGLVPVEDANRRDLIRRAYFTLWGLPPTPQQIADFVQDTRPVSVAIEDLVDRLLESPHFGERWGRHWLDVVRYAESSGGGRTLLFPEAWRYRDYVVDAFNRDLPFDDFIREQVAGDLLQSGDWQGRSRRIVATAMLVLGPTNYELQDKDILESDIVDEQLDTLGKSFLGMTIGCARCHDHKFDPIPTRDYYAMAGILHSTKFVVHDNVSQWSTVELPSSPDEEREIERHAAHLKEAQRALDEARAKWLAAGGRDPEKHSNGGKVAKSIDPQALPGIVIDDSAATRIGTWKESQAVAGFVGSHYLHDNNQRSEPRSIIYEPHFAESGHYEVCLIYTVGTNRSPRVPITIVHADGHAIVDVNQTKHSDSTDSPLTSLGVFRFDAQQESRVVVSNVDAAPGVVIADAVVFLSREPTANPVEAPPAAEGIVPRQQLDSLADQMEQLKRQVEQLKASMPRRATAMAVSDHAQPADSHVAIRGVVHNKGEQVARGALQIASQVTFPTIAENQSGRRELADWIADPQNPLTARVIVNRVWYWVFGEGIVRTVDNFGATGASPVNPQLLDHLADQFIRDGWSIKTLIRRLMSSHKYRLASGSEFGSDTAFGAKHRADESHADMSRVIAWTTNAQIDSDNRLMWRARRQRLDAESIRDALMLVSGRLDLAVGGANIKAGTKTEYEYVFDSPRRSVYLPVFRNTLPSIFGTFDFADPNIQSGNRTSSTIAPQALLLMNDPLVIECALAAAKQLLTEDSLSNAERIDLVYQQVLGRSPRGDERAVVEQFLESPWADDLADSRERQWSLVYQTLFQSLDFRYLK